MYTKFNRPIKHDTRDFSLVLKETTYIIEANYINVKEGINMNGMAVATSLCVSESSFPKRFTFLEISLSHTY